MGTAIVPLTILAFKSLHMHYKEHVIEYLLGE